MRSRATALAASTLLLFALAGCSTGGSADTGAGSGGDSKTDTSPSAEAKSGAKPEFVNSAPTGSPTMAMNGANFSPSSLQIKPGDTVMFTSGDDKIHGLVVADLSGVTVAKGLPEYYRFTAAGSYTVEDELSDAKATITVK